MIHNQTVNNATFRPIDNTVINSWTVNNTTFQPTGNSVIHNQTVNNATIDNTVIHSRAVNNAMFHPIGDVRELDISKKFMYEFHYIHIISTYGNHAVLLMTDTNSLVYLIETGDLYDNMCHHLNLYDMSEYPSDHPAYSTVNKVLGKIKDKMKGYPIKEFGGLRPKMYLVLERNGTEKIAKGLNKSVTRKMQHEQYCQAFLASSDRQHT